MPERMPVAIRDAFLQARRERRPVVIGIPFDLQARPWDGPADLPKPSRELLPRPSPMPPHPADVAKAAQLIAGAERIVVLGGLGAVESGAGAACLVPTGTTLEKWYANGDTLICYDYTTADGANTSRKGYFMYVESYYHLQVFMPLLQPFLPDDPTKGAPWIRLPGRITVVIN